MTEPQQPSPWRVFEKGIFDDLPTKFGSIRIFRGEECVAIIPVCGDGDSFVEKAVKRAKVLAESMGNTIMVRLQNEISPVEEQLLRDGQKLHAIKAHRERTGASLVKSKQMIDNAIIKLAESPTIPDEDWDVWE